MRFALRHAATLVVGLCHYVQPPFACASCYSCCCFCCCGARRLSRPSTLVPPHLGNRDPSYFLVSGLVFTVACEPYLESEYGNDWMSDSPVKLLDKCVHCAGGCGRGCPALFFRVVDSYHNVQCDYTGASLLTVACAAHAAASCLSTTGCTAGCQSSQGRRWCCWDRCWLTRRRLATRRCAMYRCDTCAVPVCRPRAASAASS